MKKRYVSFGSSLFLSAALAVGPAAHAMDPSAIHLARAIGAESDKVPAKPKTPATPQTKPSTPATTTTPATKPAVAATKPTTTVTPTPKSTGMATSTKVWIGVGVAALLAAAAGGGGGGGGGGAVVPPTHP